MKKAKIGSFITGYISFLRIWILKKVHLQSLLSVIEKCFKSKQIAIF